MITNPKNDIWVERHRPNKLDDLVLSDSTRAIFDKFLKEKSIPHLLLSGPVGCGKTTLAKILINSLDCDAKELNAGDERGVETVRNEIKTFAMMRSFKRLKIVFLDEYDSATPENQDALKRTIELYSNQTRFILTCNSINRIIPAIQSRCQIITFGSLDSKQILKLLKKILDIEEIKYNIDDLLLLIEDYSPRIRNMIGYLQLNSIDGVYKYVKATGELDSLVDLIKAGQLSQIRKMSLDYVESMRHLFDKVEELTSDYEQRIKMSLDIAEHLRDDTFCPDKEINFSACCLKLMQTLGVKVK